MAKRGLGKGLDALIPGNFEPESANGAQQIAIDSIKPNPSQPRAQFDDDSLNDLANSIIEHGIIQPLILTPGEKNGQYTLIAGERRLRAAEIAGLDSVPAIIREASELERLQLALIENIQRENLSPLESANAYQKLKDEFSLSHDEISTRVGKSRSTITNTLRLLKLPQKILDSLHQGTITEGHARAILGLPSKKAQIAACESVVKKGLNVRQTEELVKKLTGKKPPKKPAKKAVPPEIKSLENALRSSLGTKVSLNHSGEGGTIVIHYYSEEELGSLINRFKELLMGRRILTNARFIEPESHSHPTKSVVIKDGIIQAVVTGKEILGQFPGYQITDLNNAWLLPSFTDAHIHLLKYGLSLQQVDCETSTKHECLSRIKIAAQSASEGKWIRGHGWNQNLWDGKYGSNEEIDAIAPSNPVYLTHKSLHCGWANSSALKIAGITENTPDPDGGSIQRTGSGQPSGIVFERAMRLIENAIPQPDDTDIISALEAAQTALNAFGITAVHDFDPWSVFNALQEMRFDRKLLIRVTKGIPREDLNRCIEKGLKTGGGNDWIKVGWLKLFADGALGPQTAAMLEPYENSDAKGMLLLSQDEIIELGISALTRNIGLAIHAIGDRAVHETLSVFTHLKNKNLLTKSTLPSRIEHVQLIQENDISVMKEVGVLASMQPIHAISDMEMAEKHWGNRCDNAYAWNGLSTAGIPLLFGSDAPVESPNPMLGMHASIHRKSFEKKSSHAWIGHQTVSFRQSLNAYTKIPNRFGGFENCGAIAKGYSSDLILLPEMQYEDLAESIQYIKPMATMLNGEWVYIKDSINIDI